MTPDLFASERRGAAVRLVALTAGEAAALAAAAALTKAAVAGAAAGAAEVAPFAGLGVAALAAASLGWTREMAAERFGMEISNALRVNLARHAVTIAGLGRKRRLGALSARLAGDVLAVKDWASHGLASAAAAGASAAAGLAALTIAAGPAGLGLGASAIALLGAAGALAAPRLARAWVDLRRERGRVAALAGDMTLGGAAIARFDVLDREAARLERRNDRLTRASLAHRALAAGLSALAALTGGALVAAGALAAHWGYGGPESLADWAAFLFGAGLIASAAAGAARAFDAWFGFRIARRRMATLARDMAPAPTAPPVAAGRGFAAVDLGLAGLIALSRGGMLYVSSGDGVRAAERVRAAASFASETRIGGAPLSALRPRDAARWCALSAPETPLLRASLRRNLALRRADADAADMVAALEAVGLSPKSWPLERMIDPELGAPDDWTQARLRLARALTHRPKLLMIAEPTLLFDPALPALLARLRVMTNAAIVCAYEGAAPPGQTLRL